MIKVALTRNKSVMFTLNLRPHHILCAQNFIGYGYDEEFTDHMNMLIDEMNEQCPEVEVKVKKV